MSTESEKFTSWYEAEKANGLVDVKFFTGDLSDVSSEEFLSEVNQLNSAEAIESTVYKDVERADMSERFAAVNSIS